MDFEKQFKLEISNYSDDELIDIINGSLKNPYFMRFSTCYKMQKNTKSERKKKG